MHVKRDEAIKLRKEGKSFREIEAATSIKRSTLSYMLKDVVLSQEQQEALQEAARANRVAFGRKAKLKPNVDACHKGGRSRWEKDKEAAKKQWAAAQKASHLSLLLSEQALLPILSRLYGDGLKKEEIGGFYIDFANECFLVEHSYDGCKGVNCIIKRFTAVEEQQDNRQRVAFINTKLIGEKRRNKLLSLRVDIHDVTELHRGVD